MPESNNHSTVAQTAARQVDETALIRAAQSDLTRFAELYDRYVQPVYRYLHSRVGNAAEAEDLTAQTFLAALESLPKYKHDGHFAAWLFSIARNKAMDHFRKQRPQTPLDLAEDLPLPLDIPELAVEREELERLAKLVRQLDEDQRELIRLRYVAELSFREMAALLGRKEDTVKKALYRLQDRLQARLKAQSEESYA